MLAPKCLHRVAIKSYAFVKIDASRSALEARSSVIPTKGDTAVPALTAVATSGIKSYSHEINIDTIRFRPEAPISAIPKAERP